MGNAAGPLSSGRLHGLDAARAISMTIGLLTHGVAAYVVSDMGWPVVDRSRTIVADAFILFVYFFRLPSFFMLSGFFARLLYTKRGPRAFAENRVKRILIPFIVALFPINVAQIAVDRVARGERVLPIGLVPQSTQHLWFLYYLSLTLAAALMLKLIPWPAGRVGAVDRWFGRTIQSASAPLVFALPTAILLVATNGITTRQGFVPDPVVLLFFCLFFGVGWLFHRQAGLIASLAEGVNRRAILAALSAVLMVVIGFQASRWGTGAIWIAYFFRAAFCWYMSFAFIGFFLKRFSAQGPILGYLADASYWSYIVHLPFLVLVQAGLAETRLPVIVKFGLVMIATVTFCLTSYHFLVRFTWLGGVLNGRRIPRAS